MQIKDRILQAGIVGCGGAGFPTHAKYDSDQIETIVINGVECEPLLQTDRYLMRNCAEKLIKAADCLLEETTAKEAIITLKKPYVPEIEALERAIKKLHSKVTLCKVDSFFPAGDEQAVVYEATGRLVPSGAIPLAVGCVVSNIATLYCIYDALEDRPFTDKYVTVAGEVKNPMVAKVPLGTPVSEVLEMAGGPVIRDYVVVNGGPMMGKLMTKEQAAETYITKTMSGLLVLPKESYIARREEVSVIHMLNRAKSACIQCRFCSDLCPRALLGHPLRPNKIMRKVATGKPLSELILDPEIQNAALCCECGICEDYACPMGLQPRRINTLIKKEMGAAGVRYHRDENAGPMVVDEAREMRKIPASRISARVGSAQYEPGLIDDLQVLKKTDRVRLTLRQGIGAPSEPVVKVGDRVKRGDVIAVCPEGKLGTTLHASIDGQVTAADGYIEIRSGKGTKK